MYQLKITKAIEKTLKKSGSPALKKKIQNLLKSPKTYGKPLRGNLQGFWKARVDPFRIVYELDEVEKLVIITKIETRDDVYEDD